MLLFYYIFQLAETNDPGTFKVWAVVGTDLHTIKVNVPRIFYVNCHTPKEGAGTSKFSVFHSSHNFLMASTITATRQYHQQCGLYVYR